jgi:CCR4-NOT transcription complex subunit 2
MNINNGIDNRFSQFPGGGQPTQNGVFNGLSSAQNIPAGFAGLQQQQSRPGGLGANQQQPMMQQQPLVVGPRSMQQQQYGAIPSGNTAIGNGLRSTSGLLGGGPHMGLSSASGQQQQQQQLGGLLQQRSMMAGSGAATSLAASLQQQQQQQQQRPGGGGLGAATGGGGGGMMMGGPRILGGPMSGPMGVPPLLQQQQQQPGGYGGGAPSGDLISMLNKATRQEDGVAAAPPPPPPPSFDASDFPSLSASGGPGGVGGHRYGNGEGEGPDSFANLLAQQQQKGGIIMGQAAAFGEEDFPALDGNGGVAGGGGGEQGDALEALRQQQVRRQQMAAQQQQQQQQQQQAMMKGLSNLPPSSNMLGAPRAAATVGGGGSQPDRFGLLGLLSVIRMTDPDLSLLALGSDLTSMGINLNDPNPLWKTQFETPWTDSSSVSSAQSKPDLDVRAPQCYLMPPQRLQPGQLGKLQLDTLFYIFYGMPGDEAQALAADELTAKGWYFHKEIRAWLMRVPNTEPLQKTDRFERGSFFVFDPATWEVVRKDNMVIEFASLERAPGLAAARAAAAAAAAAGGGGGLSQQGGPAATAAV